MKQVGAQFNWLIAMALFNTATPLDMHSKQPWDAQSARLPSTAIPQSDNALAEEQQRRSPYFMHQQTSDRRSLSLPARQPSPASPPAGSYAMAGSAPLPSVAHFLEDSSGISPGSSTTNYSPRTKTCLYKVRWTYFALGSLWRTCECSITSSSTSAN